VNVLTRVPFLI